MQHGGSGLGYSRTEVLAMPIEEAALYSELLQEARREDAKAVKRATGKR